MGLRKSAAPTVGSIISVVLIWVTLRRGQSGALEKAGGKSFVVEIPQLPGINRIDPRRPGSSVDNLCLKHNLHVLTLPALGS